MVKLIPMTCKILLLMDKEIVEKVSEHIVVPKSIGKQLKTYEKAEVIAVGDTAFSYAPKSKSVCKVGDRVYIIKYAGIVVTENAGYSAIPEEERDYFRIVNDEDILVVEEPDEQRES